MSNNLLFFRYYILFSLLFSLKNVAQPKNNLNEVNSEKKKNVINALGKTEPRFHQDYETKDSLDSPLTEPQDRSSEIPKSKNLPLTPNNAQALSASCNNEDFEASSSGTITNQASITGWSITRGDVYNGNDGCNLAGCCQSSPIESALFNAPSGLIDPIIGNVYPIFSVFGSTTSHSNAAINNPQLSKPMFGDKFIRINSSQIGGTPPFGGAYSVERLSKSFLVTPGNSLFQFAYIFVTTTGHNCCSASAFQVKLTNVTTNSVIVCPGYSLAAPSSQCSSYTINGVDFLQVQSGATVNPNAIATVFNKWKVSSLDLSPFIGQIINIDIIVSDCNDGNHFGYAYFDAQCGPMVVYGNNSPYNSSSGNISVPTCGAAGATLCATPGLGPYQWSGPGVNPPYNTYNYTNECYTSNLSGQYTLSMNPPGGCQPILSVFNLTITPAALLYGNVNQALCGSTISIVSVTPAGSASAPSSILWSPTPLSLSANTCVANYVTPPFGPTLVTVIVQDIFGCSVSKQLTLNPSPGPPTFSANFLNLQNTITCANSSVTAYAATNYTNGSITYTWQGSATSFTGQMASFTQPGTYTLQGCDPISLCCGANQTIIVGQDTAIPTATLNPVWQGICSTNSPVQTVTTNATPSVNIEHQFIWSYGGNFTTQAPTATIIPGVGTHTYIAQNLLNGCKTQLTFTLEIVNCNEISENLNRKNLVALFPNPNKGEFNLQINDPIQQGQFKLFSADGQLVFVQNVNQGNNNIKIEKLSAGIYFYSISNNKEQLKKGKLQIE
ncbi:MAG: T9SS type A sorting domain-containing protein [Bacteroidia bacterium]|nr:T9SS type A sorting domain-containing protein [Bacteroidia bacterium]